MRLIDVATMLDVETSTNEGKKVARTSKILKEFYGSDLAEKEYAILSHCWGVEKDGEQEVLLEDMKQLLTGSDEERSEIRGRTGYKKIIDTCRQSQKDGLKWVWIDTCCINKESSAELSEAINSMYSWYKNAKHCYAYLHDTIGKSWTNRREPMVTPKWFSRGWTLQELVAPKVVHFFDQSWEHVGDKAQLAATLSNMTRIPRSILENGFISGRASVAQIMSWAADRTTTREEDRAYSLLGLLGVHMPMLYGEGRHAFRRLQLEIIRTSNDQSIFAWGFTRKSGWSSSFLADDPSYFRDCSRVGSFEPELFTLGLAENSEMPVDELSKFTGERLRTFTVTNDGIQIWLPTASFGPFSEVTLACAESRKLYSMITIHLVLQHSTCFRIFGIPNSRSWKVELKQHLLPYKDSGAKYPATFTFKLDCQTLSHDGFVQDRILPDGLRAEDGSVRLSRDQDFAAITYVRRVDDTRFGVLLSHCGDLHSAFATLCIEDLEQKLSFLRWEALERLFFSGLWYKGSIIQHAHLRQSIQGLQLILLGVLVVVHLRAMLLVMTCLLGFHGNLVLQCGIVFLTKCFKCMVYLLTLLACPSHWWTQSSSWVTMVLFPKMEIWICSDLKAISLSFLQILNLNPSRISSAGSITQIQEAMF
ncbi:heterokaryon incompatibility protein-domain-containing protein [Pisolithus tinctorius]|uniref:Uncharacterized protein n=1 Tax=Pisolithus tinctorius Marx 270 TaxID=870435 RepID=A0A0C3NMC2_PISTI|nr:heterokaryon incompatibility protein-domain-containing protein [Pisolithus tinctorius]KIO02060.1 hypothetical protein M404DRAFT_711839 [Pisolithus tinctorius Marx 270]